MTEKRIGHQTVCLPSAPSILGIGTVSGRKEYLGPIGKYVDVNADQTKLNLSSWEAEERGMLQKAINTVLTKTKMLESNIDYMLMGDLLNQIVSSSYTARENAIPFIGLYGACSTMALSLSVASMLIDGGFATNVIAATGSHFCTAERQYRYPLEMGVQRTASSQWTTTGSAALVLSEHRQNLPSITHVTTGRVVDFGITDVNNMGAAMAPAAISTLRAHFDETNRAPEYYDLILTGDLGMYGKSIVIDELGDEFREFSSRYTDCGCELFKGDDSVLAGGSGCGCSALYMGKVMKDFELGNLKRVLFIATGALHNPVLINQKESIPGIAHAVAIERE